MRRPRFSEQSQGRLRCHLPTLTTALENAGDLAVEEVLHLLELELVADEAADVHLAGGDQRDGRRGRSAVDEGALDGQLLLVDVVGVHLEVRLLPGPRRT